MTAPFYFYSFSFLEQPLQSIYLFDTVVDVSI